MPGCNKSFSQASNCKMHMQICGKPKERKRRHPSSGEDDGSGGGDGARKHGKRDDVGEDGPATQHEGSTSVQDTSGNSLEELERALFDRAYFDPFSPLHVHESEAHSPRMPDSHSPIPVFPAAKHY